MVEIDLGFAPNLEHIFECGQCFRWNVQTDGSYIGVAGGEAVRARVCGSKLILEGTDNTEFWSNYFDAAFDYEGAKTKFSKDKILKKCIQYGYGIRILRQDLFETIISFIISANNNIPRIKKIIESLCRICGDKIEFEGQEYYTFPKAEAIVNAGLEKLSTIHAGYRDKYILGAAQFCLNSAHFDVFPPLRVHDTRRSVQTPNCDQIQTKLNDLPTNEARRELLKIIGVGPKVADCVLLFGMSRFDVFPSDVWIKRILDEAYNVPPKEICEFAENKFGKYRGLAQQYLFYYYRDNMKKLA